MSTENPAPPPPAAPHALIRIPVRIVVLVLVLPVRLAWDALRTATRFLDRTVLRPLGRALAWPFVMLWRYVVVVPAVWLYGAVLVPLGRGIGWLLTRTGQGVAWVFGGLGRGLARVFGGVWRGLSWFLGGIWNGVSWALVRLGRGIAVLARWTGTVLAWPFVALWRWVLVPFVTYGIARPAAWLWRRVLAPLGRELADALGICWRAAGYVSRAVGRAVGWVLRTLLVRPLTWAYRHLVALPLAWAYRTICTPVGHWIRDAVWTPARTALRQAGRAAGTALAQARDTVRRARRDAWRALVGGAGPDRGGEPQVAGARTLGSTTNVPGAAPAPEISLHKQG